MSARAERAGRRRQRQDELAAAQELVVVQKAVIASLREQLAAAANSQGGQVARALGVELKRARGETEALKAAHARERQRWATETAHLGEQWREARAKVEAQRDAERRRVKALRRELARLQRPGFVGVL